MCQLYISNISKPNELDSEGRLYENIKVKDCMAVKNNDVGWGAEEDLRAWIAKYGSADALDENGNSYPNRGYIIQIPELSVADGRTFIKEGTRPAIEGQDPEFDAPDPADRIVKISFKGHRFDEDSLPIHKKSELLTNQYVEVSKDESRFAVVEKATGVQPIDEDLKGGGK